MFIEQFRPAGIVENAVLMGTEAGQDRGTRISETQHGGISGPGLYAFPGVKGDDLAVCGLFYFTAFPLAGETPDRPRAESARGQLQVIASFVPENDGGERFGAFRIQQDAGDTGGNGDLMHRQDPFTPRMAPTFFQGLCPRNFRNLNGRDSPLERSLPFG